MERPIIIVRISNAVLLLVVLLIPTTALADAILPSLALVWPITLLLFIPVVLIEATYSRMRLRTGFWAITRVTAISNLVSAIAGLPIASLLSAGLQYSLEGMRFRDLGALRAEAGKLGFVDPSTLGPHDTMTLMWLGLYPRWIMIVSAIAMMLMCYLVSWWIEGKWLQRYISRVDPASAGKCMPVARNANFLSYGFLTVVVVWALLFIWPEGISTFSGG